MHSTRSIGAKYRRTMSLPAVALACLLLHGTGHADTSAARHLSWYAVPAPDQRNWSETRIRGYAASRELDLGAPEAVLVIPALSLSVPVYPGTERRVMERGAGWVEGTAVPGEDGNVVLAAHRDSYFRELGRVQPGSVIMLRTDTTLRRYEVAETRIVDPLDVDVLNDVGEPLLTLITCYPFYYAGHAPDRFVVRARLLPEAVSPAVAAE